MATVGVAGLEERRISTLSGGEWQRVLIARTLAQETGILLLDEPTSHLDVSHQIEILSTLQALTRSGATVIAVFHDLNLAAHYCDLIVALSEGRVATTGTPGNILTREFLQEIFSLDAEVRMHLVTGRPIILPRYSHRATGGCATRVHVICGGGTGSELLHSLHNAGCRLSTGVLAMNDSDYATAVRLGVPCSAEPPFSPVSEVSRDILSGQVSDADFIVVTAAPVGEGNLTNLRILEEHSTAPILFLGGANFSEVEDHCGGQARAILGRLSASGRLTVMNGPAILERCTPQSAMKDTGKTE
jgi:iron complex transport system ATP-binding protein